MHPEVEVLSPCNHIDFHFENCAYIIKFFIYYIHNFICTTNNID